MQDSEAIAAIPAYNEAQRIAAVVQRCLKENIGVWVIDDGSSDSTAQIAKAAGATILSHSKNGGKGKAIRTALDAFQQSSHRYLIFMDADGQHEPSFLPAFIRCAQESGADLVVGNRMLESHKMPLVRRWTNRFMSRVVSFLAKQSIPDSQCGYRLVSRAFVEKFRPTTHRFDLESEMLIQAGLLNLKIESLKISTIYDGQTSHIHPLWDTFRFIRLLARYLFR